MLRALRRSGQKKVASYRNERHLQQDESMSNHIDRDVINALIAGHFADPFSVLGMHRTDAGLEVRALLPDATDVWVIEPKTGRKVGKLRMSRLAWFLQRRPAAA